MWGQLIVLSLILIQVVPAPGTDTKEVVGWKELMELIGEKLQEELEKSGGNKDLSEIVQGFLERTSTEGAAAAQETVERDNDTTNTTAPVEVLGCENCGGGGGSKIRNKGAATEPPLTPFFLETKIKWKRHLHSEDISSGAAGSRWLPLCWALGLLLPCFALLFVTSIAS